MKSSSSFAHGTHMDASTALRRASNLVAALATVSPSDMGLPVVCKQTRCDSFYPDDVEVEVGYYLEDTTFDGGWGFLTDAQFQTWLDDTEGRILDGSWGTDARRVVLVTLPTAG